MNTETVIEETVNASRVEIDLTSGFVNRPAIPVTLFLCGRICEKERVFLEVRVKDHWMPLKRDGKDLCFGETDNYVVVNFPCYLRISKPVTKFPVGVEGQREIRNRGTGSCQQTCLSKTCGE